MGYNTREVCVQELPHIVLVVVLVIILVIELIYLVSFPSTDGNGMEVGSVIITFFYPFVP